MAELVTTVPAGPLRRPELEVFRYDDRIVRHFTQYACMVTNLPYLVEFRLYHRVAPIVTIARGKTIGFTNTLIEFCVRRFTSEPEVSR